MKAKLIIITTAAAAMMLGLVLTHAREKNNAAITATFACPMPPQIKSDDKDDTSWTGKSNIVFSIKKTTLPTQWMGQSFFAGSITGLNKTYGGIGSIQCLYTLKTKEIGPTTLSLSLSQTDIQAKLGIKGYQLKSASISSACTPNKTSWLCVIVKK